MGRIILYPKDWALSTYRLANGTWILTFSTFHVLKKIVLLPLSHRTKIQQLVDLQVWKIFHHVDSFASKQKFLNSGAHARVHALNWDEKNLANFAPIKNTHVHVDVIIESSILKIIFVIPIEVHTNWELCKSYVNTYVMCRDDENQNFVVFNENRAIFDKKK